MLWVHDELAQVAHGLDAAFAHTPFLAAFTFGEQGALNSTGNQHGNLMIAATVFERG